VILLDTNIVVAYFNGDRRVVARLMDKLPAIALPAPVVAELDFGAKASQNKKKNLETLDELVSLVPVLPFDLDAARKLGSIKSELRQIGKPTGEVDAMIAAIALVHDSILVSGNIRHFQYINNLKLECWI